MSITFFDYQEAMALANAAYSQGYIDAFAQNPLKDAIGDDEEFFDYLVWKFVGEGKTVKDMIDLYKAETEEEK